MAIVPKALQQHEQARRAARAGDESPRSYKLTFVSVRPNNRRRWRTTERGGRVTKTGDCGMGVMCVVYVGRTDKECGMKNVREV